MRPGLSYEEWFRLQYPNALPGMSPERYAEYLRYKEDADPQSRIWNDLTKGNISGLDAQGQLAGAGISLSPMQNEYLNNVIAQDATNAANAYNEKMVNNSIISAANQYSSLGLNPASVMSTGGAGIGSTSTADTSNRNIEQEKALNEFNEKAKTTRTVLGIVGGLVGAGIHGSSLVAARLAASKMASSAAHSAVNTLGKVKSSPSEYDGMSWEDLLKVASSI